MNPADPARLSCESVRVRSAATADAAWRRDEEAFREAVAGQRGALLAHCYRMLGSAHDAEDALQETLLKAWRALPDHQGRSSLGTWLYRIATNVCIDAIRRRPKRVLPIDYGPPIESGEQEPREPVSEPVWIEPFPDQELGIGGGPATPEARYEQREALELAFIAALQHLPAQQRAVLILRDVLGFSAREVSVMLETTVASINSALQRARWAVEERLPERSQQAALRSLGDPRVRDLVERFANAFEAGDVGAILALLAEDATFSMPPYPGWHRGREAIGDSWLMPGGPAPRLRYVPTRANGQLALGVYRRDVDAGGYVAICLDVLAVDAEGITEVIAFRSLDGYSRFGIPEKIPDLNGP
jgi:RNA polymerase sigma-70 factor (ECF subfamily)